MSNSTILPAFGDFDEDFHLKENDLEEIDSNENITYINYDRILLGFTLIFLVKKFKTFLKKIFKTSCFITYPT